METLMLTLARSSASSKLHESSFLLIVEEDVSIGEGSYRVAKKIQLLRLCNTARCPKLSTDQYLLRDKMPVQ